MQVYITMGQTESLLGKEGTIKLGIMKLNPDSDGSRGPVSGCKSQNVPI